MPGPLPHRPALELPASAVEAAEMLVAHRLERLGVGCERLVLAAHWADLHPGELDAGTVADKSRGGMRSRQAGADGTPDVAEDAAAELGILLGIHPRAATSLLTNAVNLRHRHPKLWSRVVAGQVEDWVATKTAQLVAAAGLDVNQARWVDAATYAQATGLSGLPPARYFDLLQARIIAADPDAAEHRRREQEADRFVRFTQSTTVDELGGAGVKSMVARANAGDLIYLDAMVDRIADILATHHGDLDTKDVRRSKALGILANPARAIRMLADATQSPVTDEPDPDEPDTDEPDTEVFGADLAEVAEKLPASLLPAAIVYIHLAVGSPVARVEGVGPVTLEQAREWLGHCNVKIVPVIDLNNMPSSDAYEAPARVGEAVRLVFPHEAFPYATRTSRRADLDHTRPYRQREPAGQPAQTGIGNLAPLHRQHHRIKTHAHGWRMTQPEPGVVHWRTPTGYWATTDASGTRTHHDDSPMERRLRDLTADWHT